MSRALFASSGNGYALLKRCAGGLCKILSLLESPYGEFDRALSRSRVSKGGNMTARGQAGRLKMPNRARAPARGRSSSLLSPPWSAAAGSFFKCGNLLQSMANVSVCVISVGAIIAPLSCVFLRV
jgi:hypothetical protein